MGIFDWWIDKTVNDTVKKRLEERIPAMVEDAIDKLCAERGISRYEAGFKERNPNN